MHDYDGVNFVFKKIETIKKLKKKCSNRKNNDNLFICFQYLYALSGQNIMNMPL